MASCTLSGREVADAGTDADAEPPRLSARSQQANEARFSEDQRSSVAGSLEEYTSM